jgi:cation diffusion facilitator CzcD-associated flavoprotein CzcO
VAVDHDLLKYMKFEHRVVGASWNEEESRWEVRIRKPDGSEFTDTCQVLVNGCGVLK